MSSSSEKFRIHTLIACLIIFSVLSLAHTLALSIKTDVEIHQLLFQLDYGNPTNTTKTAIWNNIHNLSAITGWGFLLGMADVFLGIDMPMPIPIFVTLFNGILLGLIGYCIAYIIRSFVPLLPGS